MYDLNFTEWRELFFAWPKIFSQFFSPFFSPFSLQPLFSLHFLSIFRFQNPFLGVLSWVRIKLDAMRVCGHFFQKSGLSSAFAGFHYMVKDSSQFHSSPNTDKILKTIRGKPHAGSNPAPSAINVSNIDVDCSEQNPCFYRGFVLLRSKYTGKPQFLAKITIL